MLFEALHRLAWKGFKSWLQVFHKDKQHVIQDFTEILTELADNVCQDEAEEVIENPFENFLLMY